MVGLAFGIILVAGAVFYLAFGSTKSGAIVPTMLLFLGTGICLILDISWWWVLLICAFVAPIFYGMFLSSKSRKYM